MTRRKKRIRRAGRFSTVTTCISTTLVLVLLGFIVLFVSIGTNYSHQLREGLTIEVMLDDSIATHDLELVQTRLRQAPYAREVRYISKEHGTQEMNEALQGDMSDFLGASPIPAEFEVYLRADYAAVDSLDRYERSIRLMRGVTDVSYPREIMKSLDRTIPAVGIGLLVVAALLAVISFSLINNTIRLSVYARRFSIHAMKLVGAEWSFIRRPFLWHAFLIGFVAAVIAGGLLGAAMYYLKYQAGMGDIYLNTLITPAVWLSTMGVILVCGLVLTVWCAYISVNRHLRMKGSKMYLM